MPTYLYFLNEPKSRDRLGGQRIKVNEWLEHGNSRQALDYLFVAYTTEHFPTASKEGRKAIMDVAEQAARERGFMAYWIDFLGMEQQDRHHEVYRINDVVRGASAVAIAVADPHSHQGAPLPPEQLLKTWGRRLWTFPEVLLAPSGQPIWIYQRGRLDGPVLKWRKIEFAARVWDDALVSRELVDHFEGTLPLSRLQLMICALQ